MRIRQDLDPRWKVTPESMGRASFDDTTSRSAKNDDIVGAAKTFEPEDIGRCPVQLENVNEDKLEAGGLQTWSLENMYTTLVCCSLLSKSIRYPGKLFIKVESTDVPKKKMRSRCLTKDSRVFGEQASNVTHRLVRQLLFWSELASYSI